MSKKLPIVGRHLLRAGPVMVMCLCALVMGSSGAYGVVVSALHGTFGLDSDTPTAPMLHTADRFTYHENLTGSPTPTNNHFGDDHAGDTLAAAGFTVVDSLTSLFSSGTVAGSITSTVYEWSDGGTGDYHLLFTYSITNTGTSGFANGNIMSPAFNDVDFVDAGEIQTTDVYTAGEDYLNFERAAVSDPGFLRWYWLNSGSTGGPGAKLTSATGTSTTLYIETDAFVYSRGIAQIIDGSTADHIPVLVPGLIPEPLTMLGLFLGLGGVGAYIRKRRMA